MLAPINYKKGPILTSQNVTGADGYLLSAQQKNGLKSVRFLLIDFGLCLGGGRFCFS